MLELFISHCILSKILLFLDSLVLIFKKKQEAPVEELKNWFFSTISTLSELLITLNFSSYWKNGNNNSCSIHIARLLRLLNEDSESEQGSIKNTTPRVNNTKNRK